MFDINGYTNIEQAGVENISIRLIKNINASDLEELKMEYQKFLSEQERTPTNYIETHQPTIHQAPQFQPNITPHIERQPMLYNKHPLIKNYSHLIQQALP